jgi:hypothetical protein
MCVDHALLLVLLVERGRGASRRRMRSSIRFCVVVQGIDAPIDCGLVFLSFSYALSLPCEVVCASRDEDASVSTTVCVERERRAAAVAAGAAPRPPKATEPPPPVAAPLLAAPTYPPCTMA